MKELVKEFILEKFASWGLSREQIIDILKSDLTKKAVAQTIDECAFEKNAQDLLSSAAQILFGTIPAGVLTAGVLAGPTLWLLSHPDEKLFKAMSDRRKLLKRELRELDLQNPRFYQEPFPSTTLSDTGVV